MEPRWQGTRRGGHRRLGHSGGLLGARGPEGGQAPARCGCIRPAAGSTVAGVPFSSPNTAHTLSHEGGVHGIWGK